MPTAAFQAAALCPRHPRGAGEEGPGGLPRPAVLYRHFVCLRLCCGRVAGRRNRAARRRHGPIAYAAGSGFRRRRRRARADIVDRNGKLLATTLDSPSLYANPKQILDPADATRKLVKAFPSLKTAEVYAKLTSGKSFVYIKRHLTPRRAVRGQSARYSGAAVRARRAPRLSGWDV